jgi:hypothetical protein
MLNTSNSLFDEDGSCLDLSAKMQLETVRRQVVEFASGHSGSLPKVTADLVESSLAGGLR